MLGYGLLKDSPANRDPCSGRSALIVGLEGEALTEGEAEFLRTVRPCGIILFSRNCTTHDQIRALVDSARAACGTDVLLVLIDQEGGRVQRLRPPLGRLLPPAAAFGRFYEDAPEEALSAARHVAQLVAQDLAVLGINTVCAPVLDLPVAGAHDIIGDRAYGHDASRVIALGRAVAEGLLAGGALPIVKHIPGHGRATEDSHLGLPIVTATREELGESDFAPFKALAHLPAAMTAHVVFTAIDDGAPASISPRVTSGIIRGEIGFDGFLVSDDITMRALSGEVRDRAEAVIRAGSDVALHCNGDLDEMRAAAAGVPSLDGDTLRRFNAAFAALARANPLDVARAESSLARLLANYAKSPESV